VWPSGGPFPRWLVGPDTKSMDATNAMWEFFRSRRPRAGFEALGPRRPLPPGPIHLVCGRRGPQLKRNPFGGVDQSMGSRSTDPGLGSHVPVAQPLVLALVLLAACGGGRGLPDWKTSPAPRPNAKRVDYVEKVTNARDWARSPYFRVNDALEFPVYLIVAVDGTACIAPADDWTIADRGDFYPCPREWRIARPS
jgi:hypothetical protein